MIKGVFIVLIAALVLVCAAPGSSRESGEHRPLGATGTQPVPVHFFWSETCPHCTKAKAFLEAQVKRDAGIVLQARIPLLVYRIDHDDFGSFQSKVMRV